MARCSAYRPVRLASYTFKVTEQIVDQRLREIVKTVLNMCRFVWIMSTTDVRHAVRPLTETHKAKRRTAHPAFRTWKRLSRVSLSLYDGFFERSTFAKSALTGSRWFTKTQKPYHCNKKVSINVEVHRGSVFFPSKIEMWPPQVENLPTPIWFEVNCQKTWCMELGPNTFRNEPLQKVSSFKYSGNFASK